MEHELSITPTLGWKYVHSNAEFINSPMYGQKWYPGVVEQSTCKVDREMLRHFSSKDIPTPPFHGPQEVPFEQCNCGYHSLPYEKVRRYTNHHKIWLAILQWGKVIEHDAGSRSRYAMPVGLLIDTNKPKSLIDFYNMAHKQVWDALEFPTGFTVEGQPSRFAAATIEYDIWEKFNSGHWETEENPTHRAASQEDYRERIRAIYADDGEYLRLQADYKRASEVVYSSMQTVIQSYSSSVTSSTPFKTPSGYTQYYHQQWIRTPPPKALPQSTLSKNFEGTKRTAMDYINKANKYLR